MSSMHSSSAMNHSSHPSTLSWGKMLLAAGGVVATGLLGVQYIRFRSQSSSSSSSSSSYDPANRDAANAAAKSDQAAQAASADKLLERMQKMVNKLESVDYTSDSDVEVSQSEVDSSSSITNARSLQQLRHISNDMHRLNMYGFIDVLRCLTVAASICFFVWLLSFLAPPSFGIKSNLSRLLRNARLCASSPTRAREKNIRLQHRLLMARLLLAVHRSGRARSVTSLASADEEMRADYEKAWKLCEGNQRKTEAEELDVARAKPYDPSFPYRQQLDYLLLRVAAELKDAPRMLKSLARLLHIDFDAASATASTAASSSSHSHPLHTPVLISSSVLDSLSRPSLLLAYTIAPLLGCWLWSFQLGQKLFPNRAPAAASTNPNTHDEIPLSLTHASASPDETYEEMHTTALTQSKLIDYSVVYELATQRAVKKCLLDAVQSFPTPAGDNHAGAAGNTARLQSRLHLSESFLHTPSALPFDEQGRLMYGNPSAASAIITPPPSVTSSINSAFSQPMSPSSSVAGGDQLVVAPSPLFEVLPSTVNQSVNWEEWEIRAYTTSVESVDTPDINLKKQLFSILNSQKDQIHEFPSSSSPPHMASPNSADAFTASDSSPTAAASPTPPSTIPVQGPRQIYREGTLFHSVGLFGQQVPVVGTIIRSPLSSSLNSLHSDSNALSFFMQGYCHVQGPTIDQDYNQFEYYCFNQPSAHGSGISSPTTHSSNSNIITQSMIEAHALSSEENTAAASLIHSPVAAHTGATNSALLSPMANSTHLFDSASFASLHMQHFHDPSSGAGHVPGDHTHQAHSPMLSPVGTPPLSTPSPSPLQRYVTSIPNAEVWTGTYRVIQAPIITDESPIAPSTPSSSGQRTPNVHHAPERRPFIQVTYSISLAVVQIKNRRGSTETPLPPAVTSVAHPLLPATHPSSLASSLQLEQKE